MGGKGQDAFVGLEQHGEEEQFDGENVGQEARLREVVAGVLEQVVEGRLVFRGQGMAEGVDGVGFGGEQVVGQGELLVFHGRSPGMCSERMF